MTTKKHFEKAAAIVRRLDRDPCVKQEHVLLVMAAFTDLFTDDNPAFDEEKFIRECLREEKS